MIFGSCHVSFLDLRLGWNCGLWMLLLAFCAFGGGAEDCRARSKMELAPRVCFGKALSLFRIVFLNCHASDFIYLRFFRLFVVLDDYYHP